MLANASINDTYVPTIFRYWDAARTFGLFPFKVPEMEALFATDKSARRNGGNAVAARDIQTYCKERA